MSYSLIGGADGPTSVFIAGRLGVDWINIMGIAIVVLILLPNIVYAVKFRGVTNKCTNKIMNLLEQIGRYGAMIFMVFNIGLVEFGFPSVGAFLIYLIGNVALLLAYWIIWLLYFANQKPWKSMALAIIPTMIFFISGVTLLHIPLIICAVIFGVGHIYVTYKNTKASSVKEI